MKRSALFCFLIGLSILAGAQEPERRSVGVSRQETKGNGLDLSEKYYVEVRELNHASLPVVKVKVVQTEWTEQVLAARGSHPTLQQEEIFQAKNFEPIVKLGIERKKPLAYIMIPHYIDRGNGKYEELKKYELTLEEQPVAQKVSGSKTYAAHSVLSSGTFYKVALDKQGLFKIDYAFLVNQLGITPANIQPAHIRVYGNGGEMLPESNSAYAVDDLIENAIEVVDGGDGQFNDGDYFLFYANGPHTIIKDSLNQGFTHQFNIYGDRSYYYLNFDLGAGKRIATMPELMGANVQVDTFNEFQFYERDDVNLGRFGKEFWGDEMSYLPGTTLNKVMNFSIPDIDPTTPLVLNTHTGSVTHSAQSEMKVNVNGSPIQDIFYAAFGDNYYDPVIQVRDQKTNINNPSSSISVETIFTPPTSDASAYIGYIELNARRLLKFNGYLRFADWKKVGSGNKAQYNIQHANANTKVWDITHPLQPIKMVSHLSGSTLSFIQENSGLHTFIALDGSLFQQPTYIGVQGNQDLHALKNLDYIIVAPTKLKVEAERLATHHRDKRNYNALVVSPQEIYNEFSSGSQDISAIRNFVKMLYDQSDMNKLPQDVLLFGDASYDYKDRLKNNTNLVPTHETQQSNNKILGYCSDDFFGFLDDNEDLNNYQGSTINTIDVGVGRLPVNTVTDAAKVVNKIINYDGPNSFGPWKNYATFCADNGDGARHLDDAEIMSGILADSLPAFNAQKIYVDGFVLESTPAGPRAPDANKAVLANMFNGTLLMNYNGHGGPGGWCEERIFSFNDINNLTNYNKLPLFITATCDFAPYDNPNYLSAGETLVNKADGGAIALMTTTQLVFADQNQIMNSNYMKKGFSKKTNGKFPTLGQAYMISKNMRYATFIDESTAANFRKFALLGDPGLPLAFPRYEVFTDSINGVNVSVQYDTLKALGKYRISGHVTDEFGNPVNDFNGVVYPTIFDKPKKLTTLQQTGSDPKREYYIQNNAVYKGKATVKNGRFSFTFVMPKDINYDIANGKISYYANNDVIDGNGYDQNIPLGGSSSNGVSDLVGPVIKPFLNDERFVNGGITTPNSKLIVKLYDDNGINYSGNSIGHDITAILDNNPQNTYVLNNFYEADLDDYRSGTVRFPLNYLSEGEHVITIKAWDVANNSSQATLHFNVVNQKGGQLAHVLNYPNPFSTHTQFMFEHNMPNQNLWVNIQVLSLSGKVVKTFKMNVQTEGSRLANIDWDGRDDYGDLLGNGVYLYKLNVRSSYGLSDTKLEKLVILR